MTISPRRKRAIPYLDDPLHRAHIGRAVLIDVDARDARLGREALARPLVPVVVLNHDAVPDGREGVLR